MKNFIQLVRSLRKDLGILFIACLVFVSLTDFVFIRFKEPFAGAGTIGVLAEKLCLSYISAFIFYFLVIHTKQQKDKKNIYTYVSDQVWHLIAYGTTPIRDLAKHAQIKLTSSYPSRQELLEICSRIHPYSEAPLLRGYTGGNCNWMEYFQYYINQTDDAIKEIFEHMPFLETQLIRRITALRDSQWYKLVKAVSGLPFQPTNKNLLNFSSALQEYLDTTKELQDFYNKKLQPYHNKAWGAKPIA